MRITPCLQAIEKRGGKALIPYIMAGDPDTDSTLQWMHTIHKAGADMLELGVPFSDPMADGPAIQAASERALAHKTSLQDVLQLVAHFREQNDTLPIILMSYLNPIEQMGLEAFATAANKAGVDGVLIVDTSYKEADTISQTMQEHDIVPIFLLALTTTEERIAQLAQIAKGFIYCISLKGVTGSDRLNSKEVESCVARIREQSKLPIAIGFGIRDGATAKQMADIGDAVVVGSSVVEIIARCGKDPEQCRGSLYTYIKELHDAINA